jgi:hypothetical protein
MPLPAPPSLLAHAHVHAPRVRRGAAHAHVLGLLATQLAAVLLVVVPVVVVLDQTAVVDDGTDDTRGGVRVSLLLTLLVEDLVV